MIAYCGISVPDWISHKDSITSRFHNHNVLYNRPTLVALDLKI